MQHRSSGADQARQGWLTWNEFWNLRIQHVSDTAAAPQSPDSGSPVERPRQRDNVNRTSDLPPWEQPPAQVPIANSMSRYAMV